MKVLFIISTCGPGQGGHHYSLRTLVTALHGKVQCTVVTIGLTVSAALKDTSFTALFVPFSGVNAWSAFRKLREILREEKPDVIHAFDELAMFFARVLAGSSRLPLILTRAGGANPTKYYPYTKHLILFSKENEEYFRSQAKYRDTSFYVLPNRVLDVGQDPIRIIELKKMLRPDAITFLRIGRVDAYLDIALQAIRLVNELNARGVRAQLVIIGGIQMRNSHSKLEAAGKEHTVIVTDSHFTRNASELIDIADFVVGTGRGLMEAATRGKIILAPLMNGRYPVLVNEDTFADLFRTNFSPRGVVPDHDDTKGLEQILSVCASEKERTRAREFSLAMAESYFRIDSVIDLYVNMYTSLKYENSRSPIDLLENMLYCFYRFALQRFVMSSSTREDGR